MIYGGEMDHSSGGWEGKSGWLGPRWNGRLENCDAGGVYFQVWKVQWNFKKIWILKIQILF